MLKTDSSTNYALRPELLQEAVSQDLEAGLIPFFLCANVSSSLLITCILKHVF